MAFFSDGLEINLAWTIRQRWPLGRSIHWPSQAHSLWLMIEGEVEVSSGERCWRVTPGQVFLWPRNLPRHILARRDSHWISIGLAVSSPAHPDLLSLLALPGIHTPQPTARLPIGRWIEDLLALDDYEFDQTGLLEMAGEWPKPDQKRPPHFDLIEDSLVRAIFSWCWGAWSPVDLGEVLRKKLPLWLSKTLHTIEVQPTVSVTQLAFVAGFSPAQFRRLFQQHMYQSPQRYLANSRLEMAQRLLKTTDLPVSEIARRCGFPTPTNFMTLWKRTRGISALQFRQTYQSATRSELGRAQMPI